MLLTSTMQKNSTVTIISSTQQKHFMIIETKLSNLQKTFYDYDKE